MGDIQVAADDHRLDFIQLFQIAAEGFVPGHAVIDPSKTPLGIGGIAGNQVKFLVFQSDDPALVVQLRYTDAIGNGQGVVLEDKVIMAGGTFIEGSTIELSADGPMRAPYVAYMQGGLNYAHVKICLEEMVKKL